MFKNRKKTLAVTFLAIIFLVVGVLYFIASKDTSIDSKGPTPVTDYRKLPVKEAAVVKVVENLDAPWAFEWLPSGDILVTERFGNLRIIQNGVLSSKYITGLPEVFASGQGGLLDVTIHPNFQENRYLYLSYAHGNQEGNRLRVSRAKLNEFALENFEMIFEVSQVKTGTSHFGSRFQWLPDGTLTFSVGDGGNPPTQYDGKLIREQAQLLNSHLGKIIRINDDGTVPTNNPFHGRDDARHEIYSYGHRNAQGLTYDPIRKRLVVSEHGSKGGDEVNAVLPGLNYGWPRTTYSTEYSVTGVRISDVEKLPNMEDPLGVWTPSIAPSSIVYYSGDRYDGSKGNLFLAAMLLREDNSIMSYAYSPAGGVLKISTDEAGKFTSQELIRVGDVRVRSIAQGPDGFLYVLTDGTSSQNKPGANAGSLIKIKSF